MIEVTETDENELKPEEWYNLLSNSEVCDAFQTQEWALVSRKSLNARPFFLTVRREGKIIGGVMFLRKKMFGLFDSYEIRGGPIYVKGNRDVVMKSIVEALRKKEGKSIYLLFIPFPAINHTFMEIFRNEGYHPFPFRTIIIDLKRPLEEIWGALDKRARWGVRKAERLGLEAKVADNWQEWEEYYHLHVLHSREKQYPTSPRSFFREMFKLHDKNMSRLFIAKHEEQMIAGSLFLAYKENMVFLQNSSSDTFRKFNPNNLLQWKSIEWAKENGATTYDINGLPPEETTYLRGIYDYKKRWDGRVHWFYYYVNRRALYAGVRLVRTNLLAWKLFSTFRNHGMV